MDGRIERPRDRAFAFYVTVAVVTMAACLVASVSLGETYTISPPTGGVLDIAGQSWNAANVVREQAPPLSNFTQAGGVLGAGKTMVYSVSGGNQYLTFSSIYEVGRYKHAGAWDGTTDLVLSWDTAWSGPDRGGFPATITIDVLSDVPNGPPTADFTWDAGEALSGQGFLLSDASMDDGEIVSWEWDTDDDGEFDDGDEENIVVQFAAPGTYDVSLRVTDDLDATDTVTKSIEVSAGPLPPNVPNNFILLHIEGPDDDPCGQMVAEFEASRDDLGDGVSWTRQGRASVSSAGNYSFSWTSNSVVVFDPVSIQITQGGALPNGAMPNVNWGGAGAGNQQFVKDLGAAFGAFNAAGPGGKPDHGAIAAIADEIPPCGEDSDGDGVPDHLDTDPYDSSVGGSTGEGAVTGSVKETARTPLDFSEEKSQLDAALSSLQQMFVLPEFTGQENYELQINLPIPGHDSWFVSWNTLPLSNGEESWWQALEAFRVILRALLAALLGWYYTNQVIHTLWTF